MAALTGASRDGRRKGAMAIVSRYLPPEHGAWAMLLVPFALGTFSATPSWWSLLLLVTWLAAYLTSYFALRWWKTRKLAHHGLRFRVRAIAYSTVLAVSGGALIIVAPWLPLPPWRSYRSRRQPQDWRCTAGNARRSQGLPQRPQPA